MFATVILALNCSNLCVLGNIVTGGAVYSNVAVPSAPVVFVDSSTSPNIRAVSTKTSTPSIGSPFSSVTVATTSVVASGAITPSSVDRLSWAR